MSTGRVIVVIPSPTPWDNDKDYSVGTLYSTVLAW